MTIKVKSTIDNVVTISQVDINWNGVTPEQMQDLAQRTVISKWQATYRSENTSPPTEANIQASLYTVGSHNGMTPEQAIASMSVEQLQSLLEKKLAE